MRRLGGNISDTLRARIVAHEPRSKLKLNVLWIAATVSLILYSVVFTLAPNTNGEDLAFRRRQWGDESVAERFQWIFDRSLDQISLWNARLGEQFSIFWLNVPDFLFSLAAVATLVLIAFLIATTGGGGSPPVANQVAMALLLVIALWPSMDVLFWKTAQAGYLQPLILFFFSTVFFQRASSGKIRGTPVEIFVASIATFFAGLSFENTPVVLGVVILVVGGNVLFRATLWLKWWVPILSLFLGWLILVTAPSTQYRIRFYRESFDTPSSSLEYIALSRIPDVLTKLIGSSWILIAFWAIALVWLVVQKKNVRIALASVVGLLTNIVTLVPAPYTEPRTFLFAWGLMVAVLVHVILSLEQSWIRKLLSWAASATAVLTLVYLAPGYEAFGRALDARDSYLISVAGSSECKSGVYISRISTTLPLRFLNNREEWVFASLNQVSERYGCKIKHGR